MLVREMLSGVAEAIGLSGSDLNDIRTAVSEACNNVVLHAYEGKRGPLRVEVCIAPTELGVSVRDYGRGIENAPASSYADASAGIGLHVIRTLARQVDIDEQVEGGTLIQMQFALTRSGDALMLASADGTSLPMLALASSSPPATIVSVAPISLASFVLPRILSVLAARAHFSTDRISDAQLLADAVVAHSQEAVSGDHLRVGVNVQLRDLELQIAPLSLGRAERLMGNSALDGLGQVIEKLTDSHHIASGGEYETLTLSLLDRRDR